MSGRVANLQPLAVAEAACAPYGNEPSRCGFELSRSLLLAVRESRAHRPDLVLKFGQYLLRSHAGRLGAEVWAMYEQVYIALLHYGRRPRAAGGGAQEPSEEMRLASEYYSLLAARFPDSMRVKQLEGMMWEAKGEYDMAMADYDEILEEEPNNLAALKRQVALLRARGKPAEAAKRLAAHLEVVGSDADGWLQLCDLYLSQAQYQRAKFCMEELLLLNPMAYIHHLRYAEILLTLGGVDKGGNADLVRTARKYFAHSLDLKPRGNLRALYGLLLCCAAAPKGQKTAAEVEELGACAQKKLLEEYGEAKATSMLDTVKAMSTALLS